MYLLARKIEAECEISCDYLATKGMTDTQRRVYARTLLSLLPIRANSGMLTTAMSVGKRNVARRLLMLKSPSNPKRAVSGTVKNVFATEWWIGVCLRRTSLSIG